MERIRTTEAFDLFWQNLLLLQDKNGVGELSLPRKCKAPTRFDDSSSSEHHHTTPKDFFRQHYFECLDLIVNCIRERFSQPGYAVLKNLEDLLLKSTRNENYENELEFVLNLYKYDFQPSSLKTQLELLTSFNSHKQNRSKGLFQISFPSPANLHV